MIKLVNPSLIYKSAFIEFLDENFLVDKIDEKRYRNMKDDVEGFISKNLNKPNGFMYWCIEEETSEFIGVVNVAKELDDNRRKYGLSCSYIVRPSKRKKGYGTKMLRLALEKLKDLGHEVAFIGCDFDNIGSMKVIENNGGVFEKMVKPENYNKIVKCYKIKLR